MAAVRNSLLIHIILLSGIIRTAPMPELAKSVALPTAHRDFCQIFMGFLYSK